MAESKRGVVAFLTLSSDSSAKIFVKDIEKDLPEHNCKYVQLSNDDLGPLHMHCSEGYDAVVLLHSVQEGRNAVTDVPDGKYNHLLPHLTYKYGAGRVAVVVYYMPSLQQSYNKDAMMLAFERSQPTTFLCSNCVLQCFNLHTMDTDYRCKLISFLLEAMKPPISESKTEIPVEDSPTKQKKGNAVALLHHSGPDVSLELSNDLHQKFSDITFESLDEGSVRSIHRFFKAALVLVDEKYFETECMFAYLTTSYINTIGLEGHLGLMMLEKKEEPDFLRDFSKNHDDQLLFYSLDPQNPVSERTNNDMKTWFTKKCHLKLEESKDGYPSPVSWILRCVRKNTDQSPGALGDQLPGALGAIKEK